MFQNGALFRVSEHLHSLVSTILYMHYGNSKLEFLYLSFIKLRFVDCVSERLSLRLWHHLKCLFSLILMMKGSTSVFRLHLCFSLDFHRRPASLMNRGNISVFLSLVYLCKIVSRKNVKSISWSISRSFIWKSAVLFKIFLQAALTSVSAWVTGKSSWMCCSFLQMALKLSCHFRQFTEVAQPSAILLCEVTHFYRPISLPQASSYPSADHPTASDPQGALLQTWAERLMRFKRPPLCASHFMSTHAH